MNQVAEKLSVDDILADWEHGIKPVVMKEWGENDREVLVELFGKVRDDWIERDLHGWIKANRYVSIILIESFLLLMFHFLLMKQEYLSHLGMCLNTPSSAMF